MEKAWAGYSATVWAVIFAALHVIWACGWFIGLPAGFAANAFRNRWFLAYDLGVAGLCLVAAFLGLALAEPWGRRLYRPLMLTLGYGAAAILALRGVAGVSQAARFLVAGVPFNPEWAKWDLWFCLGGLLFGRAAYFFAPRFQSRQK
jgi:hypothetical protein